MALPQRTTAAAARTPPLSRRPPSLLLPRRTVLVTAAASSARPAAPCDIDDAYYFVPPPSAVRAAVEAAVALAPSSSPSSSSPSSSSSPFYGGSPLSSSSSSSLHEHHQQQQQNPSSSSSPPSIWGAVTTLAAKAAEASSPCVVLIANALPTAQATAVSRECRALRPRLAPELNCIASGRLGCYLSSRSATHAALSDADLAKELTRRLRSSLQLRASDYPMELRHYPRGSSMPWHSDEALFGPEPQWELIYTVDNDSDSETEWRDAQGRLHGAWTPPGSLLCVKAERWQHRVTPVKRGSRLIVKLAYSAEGALPLPSFAQNLGRVAYGKAG